MVYTLFFVITTLFAVIGFVECIKSVIFRLYRSNSDKTIMLITPADGHCEDLEYTLRSCAAKVRWFGKTHPHRIICLDNGMDEQTKRVCSLVCEEHEFIDIMNISELTSLLTEK